MTRDFNILRTSHNRLCRTCKRLRRTGIDLKLMCRLENVFDVLLVLCDNELTSLLSSRNPKSLRIDFNLLKLTFHFLSVFSL